MSAHVLLNLLNELRKRDKMRGLPSILSLFRMIFETTMPRTLMYLVNSMVSVNASTKFVQIMAQP